MKQQYVFRVLDFRVVDGDTIDATIDLGFDTYIRERVRLKGVDTPEIRGSERPEGLIAKAEVEDWMETARMFGSQNAPLLLQSLDFERGKYGRVLGNFYCASLHQPSLVGSLIVRGYEQYK